MVRATATAHGLVRARLKSRGDWDVGVFDAKTKRYVAGSAGFRGNELAEGFVTKGQRLLVQACRFRGKRSSAARVGELPRPLRRRASAAPSQVVDVSTPTRADKRRLQTLGLDLTEHGDADSIEVVLYGERGRADAARRQVPLHRAHRRPRRAQSRPTAAPTAASRPRGADRQRAAERAHDATAACPTTSSS